MYTHTSKALPSHLSLAPDGVANALKIVAAPYGSWSVLSSVFSTCLAFNLVFARLILKERLTPPKILSALLIMLGAVVTVAGTPTVVAPPLSPEEFAVGFARPAAATWFALLAVAVLLSIPTILIFEKRYPPPKLSVDAAGRAVERARQEEPPPAVAGKTPSLRLGRLMALVYPASMGLDEGVADLLIAKGWQAMLSVCNDGCRDVSCAHWILWTALVLWVLAAFASALFWMRKVFGRFEVTVALPIEYGTLGFANVLTGLLFYGEHLTAKPWQLGMIIAGCSVIILGIAVGQRGYWNWYRTTGE